MTMHLGMITNRFALIVGDRLLTAKGTDGVVSRWDPFANKTLVLFTANGVVVVSYSGLGHIFGLPTDEWLFRHVTRWGLNEQGDPEGDLQGIRFGGSLSSGLHLGLVRDRIEAAVLRDLRHQQVPRRERSLDILIAGWTWKRSHRSRARSYLLSLKTADGGRRIDSQVGDRIYSRTHDNQRATFLTNGQGTKEHMSRVAEEGNELETVDEIEALIVQIIRDMGDQPNSTVGTDLVSCLLPVYEQPRIRYFWDDRHPADDDRTAYMPALVVAGTMMPSITLSGTLPMVGNILMERVPPMPENPTGAHTTHTMNRTQRRLWTPPPPRAKDLRATTEP